MMTGLKCPGCGSQRAIHSLLHFDFVQAFRYNALLVLSLPLLAVLLTGEALRTRYPAFYRRINNTKAIITLLVVVMAWWALRNVFGW
jgi:ABC-type amino acid transport system permease subunit